MSGGEKTERTRRIFGLDVLRAAAVGFVLYWHGVYVLGPLVDHKAYLTFAIDGVSLFFVLSGFLIGQILLDTIEARGFGPRALASFWVRRWFRTLPNYFLVLAIAIAIAVAAGQALPPNLPAYFVFAQNLTTAHPGLLPEAWSLTVEEWFYLLIPAITLAFAGLAPKDRGKAVLALAVAIILAVSLYRAAVTAEARYATFDLWDANIRKVVATRLDAIMYGVLGAYAKRSVPALWRSAAWPGAMLGVVLLVVGQAVVWTPWADAYRDLFRLPAESVAVLSLLPALDAWQDAKGPVAGAIAYVSRISYSLYLVNYTIVYATVLPALSAGLGIGSPDSAWAGGARYVLFMAISIALAAALHHWFEKPAMDLRDKFRLGAEGRRILAPAAGRVG